MYFNDFDRIMEKNKIMRHQSINGFLYYIHNDTKNFIIGYTEGFNFIHFIHFSYNGKYNGMYKIENMDESELETIIIDIYHENKKYIILQKKKQINNQFNGI